jgi:hypothetical protein
MSYFDIKCSSHYPLCRCFLSVLFVRPISKEVHTTKHNSVFTWYTAFIARYRGLVKGKARSHETVMGIEDGPSSICTLPRLLTGVGRLGTSPSRFSIGERAPCT